MENIIKQGIFALASTSIKQKENWFLGHVGASIIASGLLLKQKLLPVAQTNKAILNRVETIISDNKTFIHQFDNQQNTISSEQSLELIVDTLESQKHKLSASGHDVIYAALAMQAIKEYDLSLNKQVVLNIIQAIKNCKNDNPKRYYGVDDYNDIPAPIVNIENWDEFYINIINRSMTDVYCDAPGHFYAGEKLHGITFVHAIFILKKLGYHELAKPLANQLLKKMDLCELHEKGAVKSLQSYKFDVNELRVWRNIEGNDNAHQIKLVHSFYEMNQALNIPVSKLDAIWGVFKAVKDNG